MRLTVVGLFSGALLSVTAYGQSMISAHSGVVQYIEGDASIGDKPIEMKFGHFPEIKPNEIISTEAGRAEVLLTPGSFLRLAENTQVRMVSNRLTDTRFELLKGEILVESVDSTKDSAASMVKGNMISVIYKNTTTSLTKTGLFEFKAEPGRLRVYEGEAIVKAGSDQLTLKKSKETQLDGTLMAEKFDAKSTDELTRWSSRRSSYIATANVSSANTMTNNGSGWVSSLLGGGYGSGYGYNGLGYGGMGMGYGGMGMGYGSYGGWAFNPLFGMFTYVPYGGMAYSPFGYGYYSPYTVAYAPIYSTATGVGSTARANTGGNSAVAAASRSSLGSSSIVRSGLTASRGAAVSSSGSGGSTSMARGIGGASAARSSGRK
jgi:hypothetical protein